MLLFVGSALSWISFGAFVVLGVLLFQGRINTRLLYSVAAGAHRVGFAFLLGFLVLNAALIFLSKLENVRIRLTGRYLWKAVWVICITVFLHVFLTPARYVHPEGNAWISTGRAGPWPVSEQVARRYLWNEIEWSFLIVFGGSSLLAVASRSVLQQTRPASAADKL